VPIAPGVQGRQFPPICSRFGCRKATDLENDEMLMGIPFNKLKEIVNTLENLYEGPLPKARK